MECYNLFSNNYRAEDQELRHEPPDIFLKDQIFDVKFSPTYNVIATSQVTGEIRLFSYNEEANEEVLCLNYHKDSCRTLEFSDDGHFLFTGASDNSIGIVTGGELLYQVKKAHNSPINMIKYIENNSVIATGDDDGEIKIWDFRISSTSADKLCVASFQENEDTITDMVLNDEKNKLLVTSNDGFFGVYDIRRASSTTGSNTFTLDNAKSKFSPSLFAMSDNMEEELSSVCIVKNGKKVIVSTQEGVVMLFSWDWFGDCDDRMTSHPSAVS
jgi:WD40 repeat protein